MKKRLTYNTLSLGVFLSFLLIVCFILSLKIGEPQLDLLSLVEVFKGNVPHIQSIVVLEIRLPRSLIAIMAGSMLSIAGLILQDTFQNDLATPELISVTSGASFAMAVITVFGLPIIFSLRPVIALILGLMTGGLVLISSLGFLKKGSLILIGAAVSAFLQALVIIIIALGKENQIGMLFFYLAGSLSSLNWSHVKLILPWFILFVPISFLCARFLNILRLGDEVATGRGVNVYKLKSILLVISVCLTAIIVANCGPIGFLSLIVPHLTRRLLRTKDTKYVLPITALSGSVFLLLSDILIRYVFYPVEFPVGLLTTIIGGILFLLLLYRKAVKT